jgi:alanine racemase
MLRLMTHLASAEARDRSMTCEQIDRFAALTSALPGERSIANSAGLILWDEARVEWVRPGLMLYGISPIPDVSAGDLGLRPAMTLATQLISVRRVPVGETVGYGGLWSASRDSIIGIAAVGYGDGYPRHMRSGTPVLVNAQEAELVGRVSMDMIAIDITQIAAQVGDPVTLWGEGLPAERIAPYADTIAYELVCGISQRVAVELI